MKRFKIFVLLVLAILLVAGCDRPAPRPTLIPTVEDVEEPTDVPEEAPEEPTETLPAETPEEESEQTEEAPAVDQPVLEVDPLTGVIWTLVELNGQPRIPDTEILASFEADGSVTGTAGCNNYTSTYEISANQITFGLGAMTRKMCAEDVMDQENEYMAALAVARTYELIEGRLYLFDESFNATAVFEAVNQGLSGSSWEVIAYNNSQEAVVTVILASQITISFGEDGQISGNAGCNDYFGAYEVIGENISFGPIGMTKKACLEPEGVMEQETLFLAALETATTYRVEGSTMVLSSADGARAASFQRITEDETGGILEQDLEAESPAITGMVTFPEAISIPDNATLIVQIQDTSQADAPAQVIGEQVITMPGLFPIAFEVPYDPDDIIDSHSYSLSARITTNDDSLLFINDINIAVITRDNPTENVEIPVIQVGG